MDREVELTEYVSARGVVLSLPGVAADRPRRAARFRPAGYRGRGRRRLLDVPCLATAVQLRALL
jgi:hypothetical protein